MLSVVIKALKKSFIFLCTPFANRCSIYSDWAFEMITAVSVIKRLCLYEFTIWGRDLVSVVLVIEFVFKKIYENLVGTLKTVRNIEVSVPRGSTYCICLSTIGFYGNVNIHITATLHLLKCYKVNLRKQKLLQLF